MAFKVKKPAKPEMVDKRVSVPGEIWAAVELAAKRDSVDPQEVIRQALAYALKLELKEVKLSSKPSEA